MGYQESLIPAGSLEEARGIMQAYKNASENTLVDPLAIVRASGSSNDGAVKEGGLYVVVGGERFPLQSWNEQALDFDMYNAQEGGDVRFRDVTKSASQVSTGQGALEKTASQIEAILARSAKRDEQMVRAFEATGKTSEPQKEKIMTAEFMEEAEQLAAVGAAVAAGATHPKLEWVNITMKGAFLKEHTNAATGTQFFDVRIPEGTKIGGAIDVGGYHFSVDASRVRESKYDPNGVTVGLIKNKPLRLKKPFKNEDGSFSSITKDVQPENLRVAINEQYKNYKAARTSERAVKRPEKAVSRETRETPAKDQKAATKSAAARSKSGAATPTQQITR